MAKADINISGLNEEELLNLRISQLPLSIEGTWLQACIQQLYSELDERDIGFKPSCYLADEWLTPDNEPVIGIPFFLAHPVLMKLEKKMMLDVEGGTRTWCMKLLRHETGHAINYAYKLYRRKKWREIFGPFSQEYADTYRFRPYSKNFVIHLQDHYAQCHPDEDFAETFAVWLNPRINWKKQYRGWRAINKLKYVEDIIEDIKNKPPLVKRGKKYWEASRMKSTLRSYYKKKRYINAENFPDFHDANLKKIFACENPGEEPVLGAADVVKRHKKEILNNVARWTGEKKYIINDLLSAIYERCRSLNLCTAREEVRVISEISVYVATLVMNYLYTGSFRKE
ncbi:MAG: hypothetical protein GF375_02395 [Candidatus Omnitrophica bacterium]|nr:hypothetical protein [Candidatus Omnitrophota bacterium]MBD3268950.1 hypothetical protein [Candidatus Omnitrophota bacterium]